jgi:hypothetical protein
LAADKAALDAAFREITSAPGRVTCPGNIQSPGPWRRNATPTQVAGALYCAIQDGRPTVAWTDDAHLLLNVARSAVDGPTLEQIYAWWSSHS